MCPFAIFSLLTGSPLEKIAALDALVQPLFELPLFEYRFFFILLHRGFRAKGTVPDQMFGGFAPWTRCSLLTDR